MNKRDFGPISPEFLSRSVATLINREPLVVKETSLVSEVLTLIKREKMGGVLVTDSKGALTGIFTERDCVLKVVETYCVGGSDEPVSRFMTKSPTSVAPDAPLAYALNLMSHGGFRNLPVVAEGEILGLVSVKDVLDELVKAMVTEITVP